MSLKAGMFVYLEEQVVSRALRRGNRRSTYSADHFIVGKHFAADSMGFWISDLLDAKD